MRSRPGNLFEMHRDAERSLLQLLILNEEFSPQMRGGGSRERGREGGREEGVRERGSASEGEGVSERGRE